MSVGNDEAIALLREIRDQQREQLVLARRAVEHAETQAKLATDAAERSIAHQQQAIATQGDGIRLYKRVVVVALAVIAALVILAVKVVYPYL